MQYLFIDELELIQIQRLKKILQGRGCNSPIQDIYWFEIPQNLLRSIQKEHFHSCGPYVSSLETGKDWIKLELLIRPKKSLHCNCVALPTRKQREYLFKLMDECMAKLSFK